MIGQTVSHYRILSKLGAGGMGVVYQAEDTRLKRTVALKFLPADLTRDEGAKTRFIHEARAASALQHHNICTIHEIDESADGQLFIAMDCYAGETLKEKIAKGRLPVGEAVGIAVQVAEGLAKAHAAGMVHRDLKPANIMVTSDGVVKILDFGLAKLAGMTKVTRTGMTVGTVAYMSPEQARGEEVDQRTDIWSLGAVLYEMLTGKVPFPGEHEAAVLYGIMNTEPKPLAEVDRQIGEALQGIVDRALKKNPTERYQTVFEIQDNLGAVNPWGGEGGGQRRRVSGNARRAPGETRARRIVAVIGAIAVLAVLGVLIGPRLWRSATVNDVHALAVMDFRDLATPDDPLVSAGITELANIGLIQADLVRVISSDLLHDLRRRLFGSARGAIEESQTIEIARKAGATLFLTGTIHPSASGTLITWHLVDARSGDDVKAGRLEGRELAPLADRMIAEALPLIARRCGVETKAAPTALETITTASPDAYQHYSAGVLALEESRADLGIAELERAVALDSTFALAHFRLGRAYYLAGLYQDWANARKQLGTAWNLKSRLGTKDQMHLEAVYLLASGESNKQREGVAILRQMRQRWPDDREVLIELESHLKNYWYFAEALEVIEEGRRLFPDDNVINGPDCVSVLGMLGRNKEALHVARASVKRAPRDPGLWDALGSAYLAMGQPDSAEAAFRKAVALDPEWAPENFAHCAYWRGDMKMAIGIFEQILEQKNLSSNRRGNLIMLSTQGLNLAALYVEAGRYRQAREVSAEYMGGHQFGRANQLLLMMGSAQEVIDRIDQAGITSGAWFRHRGMALAMLGDAEGAREAGASAESQWDGIVRVYKVLTEAEAALVDRNPKAAVDSLMVMKQLVPGVFVAPGGTFLDIRAQTALARAYRMEDRLDEAARVYEGWLRRCAGHALSHYELGQIYEEMKRPADAKTEYATFLEMWSDADDGIPQLVDAKQRFSRLQGALSP